MQDFELENQLATQRYQQALAAQQKAGQMPQGKMVGNQYVRAHPMQYLSEVLRSYNAGQEKRGAEQELKDLQGKKQTAMADALRTYTDKATGAPAVASTTTPTQMPSFDEADAASMQGVQGYGATTGAQAARAPDMRAAYGALMNAPDAAMRSAGMTGMARIPELEATAADRQETRAARAQEVKDRLDAQAKLEAQRAQDRKDTEAQRAQDRADAQQRQFDNQRQMQQFAVANRPERMVTVLGPNGEAVTVPQSQSQGLPLYNPQAAGNLQKEKTKAQAKDQLSGVVQQLNNSYTALEQGGGITSTAQGGLSNLGARLGSTGFGQAVGGALGTANQRQRQEIEQTRPLLLNLIKDATGMTASQMNSNAEMQLYLKAATDPTLTVEANRSALANLDKMFGLGLAKPPADAAKPPAGAATPQDAAAMQWAQQNPNDPRSKAILQRLGGR